MVITLLNQKGGVGKTTLSVNLAMELAIRGAKVLLLDADKQQSALDWMAARAETLPFTILAQPKPILHQQCPRLSDDYTYIIIDAPPHSTDIFRSAVMASGIVLIPVCPSPYDVWAAEGTVKLIQEALPYKPDLKSAFVVNQKKPNTIIGSDVVESLKDLQLPVLKSEICHRVAFAETAAKGRTVTEDPISDPKAAHEIDDFVTEVLDL